MSAILEYLEASAKNITRVCVDVDLAFAIQEASKPLVEALQNGARIYVAGNGGSFAHAQHFAAELVGWFYHRSPPLPVCTLGANSSFVTAWGNDESFTNVFAREFRALARKGDALLIFSTSGNSQNIIRVLEDAKAMGIPSVGILGHNGGAAKPRCTASVVVELEETPQIQEVHQIILHALVAEILRNLDK